MILRDYQRKCSDAIVAAWNEGASALVVQPTGTGKTIVFADIIRRRFPRRAIVVAHRQELIWQARDRIHEATGMRVEVEMGEHRAQLDGGLFGRAHIVVSTIQTLTSGGDGGGRMGKFDPMQFGTLIIDEAHHAIAKSYRRFIEYCRTNPKLKVLGVTATPDRRDEEALGQVFETVAFDYEILDAIHDGWLVPVEQQMVTVTPLDLSGVRTTAGDLNGADLAAVLEQEKVLHEMATPAIEIIGNKQTLVFTASVKHAQAISEIFNRHRPGSSVWVCGATEKDERNKINDDFRKKKVQILCNCATHTEGFDSPSVEVVMMAKPTESRALYAQMIGRATRPLPGVVDHGFTEEDSPNFRKERIAASQKPSCLVIDFVGNSGKHKLMTTADILGGNISEEAILNVIERARRSGRPVKTAEMLDEEEAAAKERERKRLEDEARRARLVAKTKYSVQTVNPFDVLQIKPVVSRGWDKAKTLSERQRNFLRRSGINPDKIDYPSAKILIGELISRFDRKLCTYAQAKVLRKFRCPTDVPFEVASKAIDAIAKNGWRVPNGLAESMKPQETATIDSDNPF